MYEKNALFEKKGIKSLLILKNHPTFAAILTNFSSKAAALQSLVWESHSTNGLAGGGTDRHISV